MNNNKNHQTLIRWWKEEAMLRRLLFLEKVSRLQPVVHSLRNKIVQIIEYETFNDKRNISKKVAFELIEGSERMLATVENCLFS